MEDDWEVVLPAPGEARIYCQYPLRASSFVPIEFVIDGRFEPDQERNRALMNASDRGALSEGFGAAEMAVSYACGQGWKNSHRLASAAQPSSSFDPDDGEERSWWQAELSSFAERLARLAIWSPARVFCRP